MQQQRNESLLKRIYRIAKPWVLYGGLFLILRYTGIIASVSSVAQSALMKTGIMDVSVAPEKSAGKKFDYDFSLYDINRNKVDVNSLKGKTLFINLWATWCGPCRVEMPSIQNLYNTVDKDDVVFIMLALDQKDPFNKVSSYIKDKDFSFPVYFPASPLPEILHVRTIPTTFVVNSEGTVVHKQVGAANYDTEEFKAFLARQGKSNR